MNANSRMMAVASPKIVMKVGCWNVRTMFAAGKLEEVSREMNNYGLDILGISEARWTGSGKTVGPQGEVILYSGDDRNHERGVAVMVNKKIAGSIMEWNACGDRLIKVRFFSKHIKMTVIQCYAPTNEAKLEEKEKFYEELDGEIKRTPKHDMLLVMGDMNAKIGSDNFGYEQTMGKHGCGEQNENGGLFCDLCQGNDMVIGGSLFNHKEIHKTTWTSPDGQSKNQIDHLAIRRKFRTSLLDLRAYRGADVGSDHELIIGRIKLKLAKICKKEGRRKRLDVKVLKTPEKAAEFRLELRNKFEVLSEAEDIEQHWNQYQEIYKKTGEKILGFKSRQKKEWITEDTWKSIEKRKGIKAAINQAKSRRIKERKQEEYRCMDKEVKYKTRNDKRQYVDQMASQAEEAAGRDHLGTLYLITKKLTRKSECSRSQIRNKEGEVITEEHKVLERWKQHFEEVLNIEGETTEIQCRGTIALDIGVEPPSLEEVMKAIKKMSSGKAPGIDNIHAEMLKVEPEEAARRLKKILDKVWKEEEVPNDWKKGVIMKLPKKGDRSVCDNWRGVTLLSIPGKILCRIIIERIQEKVNEKIRKEQAGFRKGTGCINQIHILRNIIEQCLEWKQPLFINFVDFRKAFDSVNRENLWKILEEYGIPEKIINMIKAIYRNQECAVDHEGRLSEWFKVRTGVRQGCVMSGFMFLLGLDWVLRRVDKSRAKGMRWGRLQKLGDLDFADDIALLAETKQYLKLRSEILEDEARKIGLCINYKKTHIMEVNGKQDGGPFICNNKEVETVKEFTYLGSLITNKGGSTAEIKKRLQKARTVFYSFGQIWKSNVFSTRTKMKIFQSNVLSVLLYGAECWSINKSDGDRLNAFQRRCLRAILKIFWPRRISNEELRKRLEYTEVTDLIRKRRWKWIGHVMRMKPSNDSRIAMTWTPPGCRTRGRPKGSWRRMVNQEMERQGWRSWADVREAAQSREEWRLDIAALCNTWSDGNP